MTQKMQFKPASDYTFDGIKLGMNFKNDIMFKEPFNVFCDDDPIDNGTRLLVVYTATDCRKTRFPEDTSVIMYCPEYPEDKFDQPLEAIAVVHGNYFLERSDFPIKINEPFDSYDIESEPVSTRMKFIEIMRYGEDIAVVTMDVGNKKLIGGYVVGKMPDDLETESWRSIFKIYRSFMPDKIKEWFRS